jgi:DNA-binding transcriptional MocR family regulator
LTPIRSRASTAALERAIVENGVAACMVMPNFQNPLGFQMSDERKRAMVALLAGMTCR